ncbi:MAG: hypothetical protein CML81_00560 [Rhodobiaceae bacterium]|nr:hypothetical protein [Rhodobiaceae bacterium]RPF97870.1 MAG: hypothetical protein CBD87_000555 [Rhizobiales bacterium TMED227]|tara:strand:- start:3355 stop:3588 length:234 start_codon:yes stop_codon:yes gene_type:complete
MCVGPLKPKKKKVTYSSASAVQSAGASGPLSIAEQANPTASVTKKRIRKGKKQFRVTLNNNGISVGGQGGAGLNIPK